MMGTWGARRRTRLAIGCVNSGLSMMTSALGSAATAAAAVEWMRRRIVGRRARMPPIPITATSSIGNCDTRPCCAISGPPTPR